MAYRIVVVLSQSSEPSAERRDLEEGIVGELLGVEGIELTLVPHLMDLNASDTGRLCLEGISTDMIVLSWLDPHEAHSALSRHGIGGRLGHTGKQDADVDSTPPAAQPTPVFGADNGRRTIYHIDLRKVRSMADLRQQVGRVREKASVRTGGLLQVIPRPADEPLGQVARDGTNLPNVEPDSAARVPRDGGGNNDVHRSKDVNMRPRSSSSSTSGARTPDDSAADDEFDDLMDQFDKLEL